MRSDPETEARPLFPRVGAWLFQRRTVIPVPLALALLLVPADSSATPWQMPLGMALVASAEALRIWAVRHIGTISRTRSERLGPLVSTGPFAFVRNPLYVANITLWVGFALTARLAWLAPIFLVVLALKYHAIVRWEEELLHARRGDEYRAYAARVPRWIPVSRQSTVDSRQSTVDSPQSAAHERLTTVDCRLPTVFSWRETVFSERGTLIAIVAGLLLLWIKNAITTR